MDADPSHLRGDRGRLAGHGHAGGVPWTRVPLHRCPTERQPGDRQHPLSRRPARRPHGRDRLDLVYARGLGRRGQSGSQVLADASRLRRLARDPGGAENRHQESTRTVLENDRCLGSADIQEPAQGSARDQSLPRAPGRRIARADATRGEGGEDGSLPDRRIRRVDLDDGDRGRRRRPRGHRHARGERRALRPRAAAPAARADRPGPGAVVLLPGRRKRTTEPRGDGADRGDGAHHRRVRARRRRSAVPRRGHAVRHEAVGTSGPETRAALRGRRHREARTRSRVRADR